MQTWKKEITNSEICERILSEYRKLLSVGKHDEEAEKLLVDYFDSQLDDEPMLGRFWMALALYEWECGRLTQNAAVNARKWAMQHRDDISKTAREMLLYTLNMPMPPKKKIRLPSYVSHCPWPVGSLLAYRIISSDHPHVTNSPYYAKYVLLRIIQIRKHPVTQLAPNDAWDERMLVGLYNWIGDSIPDPRIADHLQFTPISVEKPMLPTSVYRRTPSIQSTVGTTQLQQLLGKTTQPRIETCCDLDWKCTKGTKTEDVFTYLGCNLNFAQEVNPFFQTSICDYAMCHSRPFDAVLVNRFYQLAEESFSGDSF